MTDPRFAAQPGTRPAVDSRASAAILLGFAGLICLAIGVAIVAGGGWSAVVVGAVLTLHSLVLTFGKGRDLWLAR